MRLRSAIIVLGFLALSTLASGQVIYIDNASAVSGGSNAYPFNQLTGYSSLHVYTAAQIAAQGVPPGSYLADLAVAPGGPGNGTYNSPTTRFLIGHLSVSPPVAGAWTTHLSSPATVHDIANGAYTFPWTASTWTPLPGVANAGFTWDGVRDVGVFFTTSTGITGNFDILTTSANLRHGVPVFNATNQTPTTVGSFAMKVRMTFVGSTPSYQVNQPAASFDVDGLSGSPYGPASVVRCGGALATANFASTNVGQGWDLAYTVPETLVPANAGGITLPGSAQILNINAAASSLAFLNGFLFPPLPATTFSAAFTVPVSFSIGAQMIVLNPGFPDNVALSQGVNLIGTIATSVPGPTGDDTFVTINLGVSPFCGPPTMAFFGVTYTQFFVTTNGRIMFPSGSASFSASIAGAQAAPGMIGAWNDLNQAIGGVVTIAGTPAGTIRVDYLGVPYYATSIATANTFGIEYDPAQLTWRIDGLGGITVHPGAANMFLGISRGAGATNPGQAAFTPAGSGGAATATDMIYRFGPGGTLTPGISNILFVPDGANNYVWGSF